MFKDRSEIFWQKRYIFKTQNKLTNIRLVEGDQVSEIQKQIRSCNQKKYIITFDIFYFRKC